MANVPLPSFTDHVDYRYFIEPLGGPTHPRNYLDRFPDALYNKAPDSHFMRFMFTLMGPAGIGWLKQNLLGARLLLEAFGAELFDLEGFYGDPFAFGRILDENYDQDIEGLLPKAVWDEIKLKDESYRTRAIQFFNAARLGTTPEGMRLAATSGTGQNVRIVENYRFQFDQHSDDPQGYIHYGSSNDLGEFIVLPQPATSRTEVQTIAFDGNVDVGTFFLVFNGRATPPLPPNVTALQVQTALQNLQTIGPFNTVVTGGPALNNIVVTFTERLSNRAIPTLVAQSNPLDPLRDSVTGALGSVFVQVTSGTLDPTTEVVYIGDADQHHMQVALDRLRPVASYPTFHQNRSDARQQAWRLAFASSEYTEVIRYVTGSASIPWPSTDNTHWIETAIENEAPRLQSASRYHYVNFHNIASIDAYTDIALTNPNYLVARPLISQYNSVHVGPFPDVAKVIPYFEQFSTDYTLVFTADRALADYPELLAVTAQPSGGAIINGIYPADYMSLQGVPQLRYHDDHFWASQERTSGAEILEIDLGVPQAVNFISMEVSRKPVDVSIDFDLLDQYPQRNFVPVVPKPGYPSDNSVYFDPSETNPWAELSYFFDDGVDLIFTRFIRLTFTRRPDSSLYGRFLFDVSKQAQLPWGVEVRNLRIGRNIVAGDVA